MFHEDLAQLHNKLLCCLAYKSFHNFSQDKNLCFMNCLKIKTVLCFMKTWHNSYFQVGQHVYCQV